MPTEVLEYGYAGDIVKSTPHPSGDGTIYVYGMAADSRIDHDGQACDPAWLARELPEWFRVGNVREQHGSIAAGVGKELEHADDGRWMLKAHIVDPGTVLKVETGVLKGFSIGARRGTIQKGKGMPPGGMIVDGKIVEVSLVDSPCNPGSFINIVKAMKTVDEVEDEYVYGELEPVDGVIVKTVDADEPDETIAAVDDESEDDSQPVDETVDDESDDDAEDGDDGEIDEDDLDDEDDALELFGEDAGDVEKGLLADLINGPKDEHKRDRGGKFAHSDSRSRAADRAKERERRLKEREAARKHHAAMDSEAARDSVHAARQGRHLEADEHRARMGRYEKALSYADARVALRIVDGVINKAITRETYHEQDDIDGAQEVMARIAELMISELHELSMGRWDELDDLGVLFRAADAMREFCAREKRQQGDDIDTYSGVEVIRKRDFSADARREAADEGQAMPDGSFPIKTAGDLDNAIHLAGNAKDPAAARAHIKRRAGALGLSARIPESWGAVAKALDGSAVEPSTLAQAEITKALEKTVEAQQAELASIRAQVDELANRPINSGYVVLNKTIMPSAPARDSASDQSNPAYWQRLADAPNVSPEVRSAHLAKATALRKG